MRRESPAHGVAVVVAVAVGERLTSEEVGVRMAVWAVWVRTARPCLYCCWVRAWGTGE